MHYVIEGHLDVDFENIGVISVNKGSWLICKPNIVHRTAYVSPNTQKFVFGFYCDTKKDYLTKAKDELLISPVKALENTNQMQMLIMLQMAEILKQSWKI